MSFDIFTMVWGDHHIGLFERACFRSLNWPKNQAAISGKTWWIYTKKEHTEKIRALVKDKPYDVNIVEIGESQRVAGCGFVPTKQCDHGVLLLNGLRDQMARCIQGGHKMLFAPPDTIFGDGSVSNLIALGSGWLDVCVAVSHPRVLPSILDDIDELGATRGAISNAQLVTLSMRNMHDSFKYAGAGDKNNSYVGGIFWKQLDRGLYSVQHRLPTHYYCGFNGSDWDFWWGQNSFGAFDHRWPAENLLRQERQRYVGSSDAAFIVEVTDWDKNVPPKDQFKKPDGLAEDAYWTNHYHNGINRQTSVIWRGE